MIFDQVRASLQRTRHEAGARRMAAKRGRIEAETGSTLLHDRRTFRGARRLSVTRWARLLKIRRKIAPSVMPAASSHARRAATGHAISPRERVDRGLPGPSSTGAASPTCPRASPRVFNVERHEFAPAEGAGKAEKDDCSVAEGAERCRRRRHGDDDVGGRGPLPNRRGADRPTDPGEHRLHLLVAGRRLVAGSAVEMPHGRQPASQGAVMAAHSATAQLS